MTSGSLDDTQLPELGGGQEARVTRRVAELFVSLDGVINRKRVHDYKLIDVPELGYFRTDRPYPRGELLVKADTMTPGYYQRPELTAAMFDADGYYRTGDVMAEIMPDRLVYVDRRNNVLKLANGEFVATTSLEGVYRAAPLVRQIFVYGSSERSNLLAVIVPTLDALSEFGDDIDAMKTALHKSLKQCAAAAQLPSYEVPVDFVVETEPFTVENGLLSGVGKLLRPRLDGTVRRAARADVHRNGGRPAQRDTGTA